MKPLKKIWMGVTIGAAVCAIVAFISFSAQLFNIGAETLGLGAMSLTYFAVCFGLCVLLLILSAEARRYWQLMAIVAVSVGFVIITGFLHHMSFSGTGEANAMTLQLELISKELARGFAYIAPGASALFYLAVTATSIMRKKAPAA